MQACSTRGEKCPALNSAAEETTAAPVWSLDPRLPGILSRAFHDPGRALFESWAENESDHAVPGASARTSSPLERCFRRQRSSRVAAAAGSPSPCESAADWKSAARGTGYRVPRGCQPESQLAAGGSAAALKPLRRKHQRSLLARRMAVAMTNENREILPELFTESIVIPGVASGNGRRAGDWKFFQFCNLWPGLVRLKT